MMTHILAKTRTRNLWGVLALMLLGSACAAPPAAHTPPMTTPVKAAQSDNDKQAKTQPIDPDLVTKVNPNAQTQPEGEKEGGEEATSNGRVEYFKMLFGGADGEVPADAVMKAADQVQRMQQAQAQTQGKTTQIKPNGAGVNKTSWTYIGPGKTIQNGQWNAKQLSGHVEAVAVNPANANTIWIGADTGGIWKSTDAGVTWKPVNDFLESLLIPTLVVNPATPTILYAGTSSANTGLPGIGILKSTDAGETWTVLPNTRNTNFGFTAKLAISTDGNNLLAATGSGLWRSTDGGSTWTQATGIANNSNLVEVAFNPADNSKAVAAGRGGSAWYSTSGGSTWTQATGLPTGRTQLAYAASSPNIVYASVDQSNGEVWQSTDGGQTYARINTGNRYLNGQGWYANFIWVDPTNPNTVIVGGFSIWGSTNGGVTFALTRSTGGPDQHVILSSPGFNGTTNKTVYVGNDGGFFRADDIYGTLSGAATRTNWTSLNERLGISQVYGVSVNAQGVVLVGLQDNGTMITANQTGDWVRVTFGDGGYSFADPTDARYFYNGFIQLGVERSSTNGGDSEGIAGSGKAAPFAILNDASNFITPILLDPNNPQRLLVGAGSLWRTNDARTATTTTTGPQWAAIKAPVTGSNINALAIAKGNSDIVWIGHNGGELFKTINGTAPTPAWTQMGQATLPQRSVNRIIIDPQNANNVYVTFGRFQANNVWRSTDGGATWASASGAGATALPALPVMAFAMHPTNSNWVYAGTTMGLFTSENGGANWTVPHDGPTNAMIWDLSWSNTTLFAASFGRGVWKTETSPNTQTCYTLGTTANPATSGVITVQTPPNCNGTQYTQGTVVTVTSVPNANAAFTGWSGDLTGVANPAIVTMTGNKAITAAFGAQATCFALALTATSGNITAAPAPNCNNGTQYTQGSVVNLTAVPNDGFAFGTWTGDATGAVSPVAVTMNAAKTVTANFVARCVALVTAAIGDGGINVAGAQGACPANSYPWGSTVNLTAVPNANSDFTIWQGDGQGTTNLLAVLMTGDKNVQAVFAAQATNDNINQAIDIPLTNPLIKETHVGRSLANVNSVYSITLSTLEATNDSGDPILCEGGDGKATVWFKFTAPGSGFLDMSTEGSDYRTVLGVWTGSPGALTSDACVDESGYDSATRDVFAQDTIHVSAGQTYYIEIADSTLPAVFEDPNNPVAPTNYGGLLVLTAKLSKANTYLPLMRR